MQQHAVGGLSGCRSLGLRESLTTRHGLTGVESSFMHLSSLKPADEKHLDIPPRLLLLQSLCWAT